MPSGNNKLNFLVLGTILSGITAWFLIALAPSWNTWLPATCMPNCFCEAVRTDNIIRQPANTWTSFAFVLAGTLILATIRERVQTSSYRLPKLYAVILAASAITIGLGSAFFHASLTLVGQFFDVFGMYLLTSFMLVYAWERLFIWQRSITLIVYVVMNVALSSLLIEVPETRRYVFAIILVVALILETAVRQRMKPCIQVKWWYSGLFLLAAAYVIWILDNKKILCEPSSLLQGHSVWHVAGAVAVVLLYHYYESETSAGG